MRSDGWIGLVDDLGRLAEMSRDEGEWAACLERVRKVTQALEPIESYWAFPGHRVFGELTT
jgi:arginine decarboxylase